MKLPTHETQALRIVDAMEQHPAWGGYYQSKDAFWARVYETHSNDEGYYIYRITRGDNFIMDGFLQRLSGVDPIPEKTFYAVADIMAARAAKHAEELPLG